MKKEALTSTRSRTTPCTLPCTCTPTVLANCTCTLLQNLNSNWLACFMPHLAARFGPIR